MIDFATTRPAPAQRLAIPASRAGWVQNASLAEPPPQSAEVLDNWFPTAQGLRLRRGSKLHATLGAAVVQVMQYAGGSTEKLFGADAASIYDITAPADPAVPPAAAVSGLTSGDWAYINFGTAGGSFLVLANGADSVRNFDGTTWTTPVITGVTSSTLSHVWEFGSRLFFVEKDTLSAWYLPADSIAGAAAQFPLRTVFSRGGALLFGARWSLDSGAGLDDVCVFVTTGGEVAIYTGTDPAVAADFVLQGVYQIAPPLSKHASFRAGGDLAIATEDGIVSLAAAVQQDRAALSRTAITYPIEDAWRDAVTLRTAAHRFNSTIWHSQTLLIVSVPDDITGAKQTFVANVRTGAWCRYTAWDVQCSAVYADRLFFGTSGSKVLEAEVTGGDESAPYTAYWLPKHQVLGGGQISLLSGRVVYRGNVALAPRLTGAVDYAADQPQPPAQGADESANVWGTAVWGTATWGASVARTVTTEWQTVNGNGFAVSAWVAATSARTTAPDAEVISQEVLYEQGIVI